MQQTQCIRKKSLEKKENTYTRKRPLNQNMKTVQKNPWKVESIQDFSCLKCPECTFFTKKENYFENHAIKKHPLSTVLFDEKISDEKYFREIKDKVKNKVQVDVNHIDVDNIKKEPTDLDMDFLIEEYEYENVHDLDNSEYDPLDFSDTNTQQKEGQISISSIPYDLSHLDNRSKKLKVEAIDSGKPYIDIQNQVDIIDNINEEKEQSEMLEAQIHVIPEKKPKKRQRKQKLAEVTNDEKWKGGHFMDSLIEYDSSINESSLNEVIEPKKLKMEPRNVDKPDSSQMDRKKLKDQNDLHEIQVPFISENKPRKGQRKQQISERNIFEKEKVEPIPTEITNDQLKGGHFMGSLLGSVDESCLKQDNEPKKMKIQSRDFDEPENNQINVLDSTKNPKEQNDKLETQIPFISENKPKKRQRKQLISERKAFGEEKKEPIVTELKSDTLEYLPYQCEECGENFDGENGKKNYKNHWKMNHSQYLPTSQTHEELVKQMSLKDIQPDLCPPEFLCSLCEYLSSSETDFKDHIESVHYKKDGKIHVCSVCDFTENNTSKFNIHRRMHKHYQCMGCENKFHGANSKTIFNMHLQKTKSQKPCNGKYVVNCDICNSRFEEENIFKAHFSSEHHVNEQQIYNCAKCHFQTEFVPMLIRHLKSHYKCRLCGEKFQGDNGFRSLKRHIVSHQQKYPKVPKPKISIKSSRKIVKDNPYDCSMCGKSFKFLSYFNRHGCITKQHLNHFESADKNFVKVEK